MKRVQKTSSCQAQNEGKEFQSQARRIYKSFFDRPKTMKMCEVETGIDRANICRRVGELKELKRIAVVKLDTCKISGFSRVQYLTTNPDLFPEDNQLRLFEE